MFLPLIWDLSSPVKDEGLMPMIFMLPPAFLLLRGLRVGPLIW